MTDAQDASERPAANFIEDLINADLAAGKNGGRVHTRFPPEPNGYLHIGHAKSICLNFGTAAKYGGKCNLRFDDTNPTAEDVEYVDSILEDVRWLGFEWNGEALYASDYFEQALRVRGAPDPRGQGLRLRPVGRADQRVPRQLLQAGQGQPLPQPHRRGEPGPVPAHAGRASSRTARACCAPRSTCSTRT